MSQHKKDEQLNIAEAGRAPLPPSGKKVRDKRKRASKWSLAIIFVLTAAVAALGAITAVTIVRAREYEVQLNNIYERSYYDLTANMGNLEVKLSKLMIASSELQIQKNLTDVSRQTEVTNVNLSQLPAAQETIGKTMRFVNQLGDYCNAMNQKVSAGGELDDGNYETLETLYGVNKTLTAELRALTAKIGNEIKLFEIGRDGMPPAGFADSFGGIADGTVDYPTLIYDGPFSDEVLSAQPKGLPENEVTKEDAAARVEEIFRSLGIASVTYTGEASGKIEAFNYDVLLSSGRTVSVQMSRRGAFPLTLSDYRAMDNYNLTVDECIKKAEEFITVLGDLKLQSVWASDYEGQVYVNLAPVVDGVIHYPDLIKVVVARDNGDIIGLESITYLFNHTQRPQNTATLSALEARRAVSAKLTIVSEKLCIIPMTGGGEKLAYEFAGTYKDDKYFVYVDAQTGLECEVFRVIDSDEGSFVV